MKKHNEPLHETKKHKHVPFELSSELKTHIEDVHENESKKNQFQLNSELKKHTEPKHENNKHKQVPFVIHCFICAYKFELNSEN